MTGTITAMSAEAIAHVAHAAGRAIQIEQADPTIDVSPHWDALDDHTRSSVIDGVNKVLSGEIRTPEESHANWCRFKEAEGWTLGEKKDLEARTHPLLVPYDNLPEHQRVKDAVFFAIVKALAPVDITASQG